MLLTKVRQHSMVRIALFLIMLLPALNLAGCGGPPPDRQTNAKKALPEHGTIVCVGDSLTAGYGIAAEQSYPGQLARKIAAADLGFQVINAGVSGETSSGTLSRINWILTMKPDIIILETGANDGLRGITPALIKRNIREIIRRLQENKIVIILAGMQMVRNLGPAYTSSFNAIYGEIARETGVLFMPFFLQGVAADPALNIGDGIHPNPQGYAIIVDNLFPYVRQAINHRTGQATAK
jgi:acyl-CoA thioesterase-1